MLGNTYSDALAAGRKSRREYEERTCFSLQVDRQPVTVVMRLEHLMKDGALHEEK